jgi:glycosyltransferase involved in cell wall biosynthesis
MPSLYAAADVYVMPSVTTPSVREPWGLGVNEAHCQRVPVVASDAVGAAAGGLVVHRETGLVVPERDAWRLSAAIRELLTDEPLAARLAAAGHSRVAETNYDAMVAGFVAAIDHAVAAHGARQGR